MAGTDHHVRRTAPRRHRTVAAATIAIITHLAILGLLASSTPSLSPHGREPRSISVDIVESVPVQKRAATRPRALQPDLIVAAPSASKAPQSPELSPAAPTAPVTQPATTSSPTSGSEALGKALRSSVIGCAHADMANLSDAERQHCRDGFAANRADAPDLTQFAIGPAKRAIYDAAWKADHSPQHMAGVICLARFGGGKLEWLHPSEGVKLGPLPCYVFTPKATFSADPPHARGWQ